MRPGTADLRPAMGLSSEIQAAYAMGHGTSGFLILVGSLGMAPLFSPLSAFLKSCRIAFVRPIGVALYDMSNTAAASPSTA